MNPSEELTPPPTESHPARRPALIGAVVGAFAMAAALVGLGAIAGAQSDDDAGEEAEPAENDTPPDTDDTPPDTDEECVGGHFGFGFGHGDFDGAFLFGHGEIDGELPFDLEIPFDLRDLESHLDELRDGIDLDLGCVEAFGDGFFSGGFFHDGVPPDFEAFEEFEECLADAGVVPFDEFGGVVPFGPSGAAPTVHIETGDGFQVVEFGDEPGSVTITGTADGVTVTTDGDLTVVGEADHDSMWEELEEAHRACEDLLP